MAADVVNGDTFARTTTSSTTEPRRRGDLHQHRPMSVRNTSMPPPAKREHMEIEALPSFAEGVTDVGTRGS
jgi:hypothetical protein